MFGLTVEPVGADEVEEELEVEVLVELFDELDELDELVLTVDVFVSLELLLEELEVEVLVGPTTDSAA